MKRILIVSCLIASSLLSYGQTILGTGSIIDSIVITPIACVGNSTNIIVYTNATANASYDLFLSNFGVWSHHPSYPIIGGSSKTLNSLNAGNIRVIVEFPVGSGIFDTLDFFISQPNNIISNHLTSDVNCVGGSDGSVNFDTYLGTPGYYYSLNGGIQQYSSTNPFVINNLSSGTYSVVISDSLGCSYTNNPVVFTITEPSTSLVATHQNTPVSCFGLSDGELSVIPSGGTSPYSYLWSTGATVNSINNLSAGAYSCTVTDLNGCTILINLTVSEPSVLNSALSSTSVSCKGGSNGVASISPFGGTAPYTFSWGLGATSPAIAGLLAGSYNCTIQDFNGCIKQDTVIVSEPATFLVLSLDSFPTTCNGGNDGSAVVISSGGVAPYSYLWSNTITDSVITGLYSGTYTVSVTDSNSCIVNEDVFVDEPLPVSISFSATNVSCFGGNDAIATAIPSGGLAPYTYLWSNGATTPTTTDLSATSYSVVVTDTMNCASVPSAITINEPLPITATSNISGVSCHNGNDGAISLTVSGGNGNYSYLWSDGQITQNAVGLIAGTYSVVITDSTNCSYIYSYFVSEPAYPLSASLTVSDVLCFGAADGSLTTITQGGTYPYSYLWSTNGQNSVSLTNLLEGIYSCTITDMNGCSIIVSDTVRQPDSLILSTSSVSASCYGASDGSATVIPQGGVSPFSYSWSNQQSSQVNSLLSAGLYSVMVFDNNNCPASSSVSVGEPTQIIASISTIDNLCYGDTLGVITINSHNGSVGPPYTYNWSNGYNGLINQNLSSGSYYLSIIDSNGCSNTFTETILQPALISASITSTDISVNGASDGTISASILGGSSPYTYSWSGPNNYTSSMSIINNLDAGVYTLVVEDINGCQQTFTQVINEPNCNVNIASTYTGPLCFGDMGLLDWQNSGGFIPYSNTLISSNGTVIIDSAQYISPSLPIQLLSGVYDLVVTDASGCSGILNIVVSTIDSIIINLNLSDALCFGDNSGTASAIISGGTAPYNVNWGGIDPNTLSAGSYNILATDNNGCSSGIVNYTINEPPYLKIDSVFTTLISCSPGNDGTATILASGGVQPFTYSWSNGQTSQTAQSLSAGMYIANISDANNCTANYSAVQLTNAPQLNISIVPTSITCNGQNDGILTSNLITGTYPVTYNWFDLSNPSVVISTDSFASNLYSGGYSVLATDIYGCTDQVTASLTNPTPLSFTLLPIDISSNGAMDGIINTSLILGGQAPYSFYWTGPNGFTSATQNLTNLQSGLYTLTVTDTNGCVLSQSTFINEPACNVSINSTITQPSCFGDNGSILWSNNGGSTPYENIITDLNLSMLLHNSFSSSGLFTLAVGDYALQVIDQYGCSDLVNIQITEPDVLISSYVTSDVSCYGGVDGTVNVSPIGGTSPYTINYGGVSSNQLSVGTYSFTVTDTNGCNSFPFLTTYDISEPDEILVSTGNTPVSCYNGTDGMATVTAIGGTTPYSYLWSPTSDTTSSITNVTSGNYYVSVTDLNGCSPSVSQTLISITQPMLQLSTSIIKTNVSCFSYTDGTAIVSTIGGTTPYTFLWSNGETTSQIDSLAAGTYTCTVTDANFCTTTETVTITEPAVVAISAGVQTNVLCNGASTGIAPLTVTGGNGTYTYTWTGADALGQGIIASNLSAGTYVVSVEDGNSCADNGNVTIVITEPAAALQATLTQVNVACNGNSTGSINLTVTGGTTAYTYSWSDGSSVVSTSEDLTSLVAGTYTCTVIDSNSCTITEAVTITEPAAALQATLTQVNVACNGNSTGSINLTVTGGTTAYTYSWSDGSSVVSTSEDLTSLVAGIYTCIVTDSNQCVFIDSTIITQPTEILANLSTVDVTCNGMLDGSALISPTGGTGTLNVVWYDNSTSLSVSALQAGFYTVTVTDSLLCTTASSPVIFNISQPDSLELETSLINATSCFGGADGSSLVNVTGGTPNYNYIWKDSLNNIISTDSFATGLSAISYSVIANDVNGCSDTIQFSIPSPQDISVNVVVDSLLCNGMANGVATAIPSGGTAPFSYLWSGGQSISTNSSYTNLNSSTTYYLTVTDSNSCVLSGIPVDVLEPSIISTTFSSVQYNGFDVSCYDSSNAIITAHTIGGNFPYTYSADNIYYTNDSIFENVSSGWFSIYITDNNGCTVVDSLEVTSPNLISSNIYTINNVTCSGGSNGSLTAITQGGVGSYSYSWSNQVNTALNAGLSEGIYSVEVVDANGCIGIDSLHLIAINEVVVTDSISPVICAGGTDGAIDLQASGGIAPYSFMWSTGNTTSSIQGLMSGSYWYSVSDLNGCITSDTVSVSESSSLLVLSTSNVNVSCYGGNDGSATIFPTGGTGGIYTYLWDNFQTTQTATGLVADTFIVAVTDSASCTVYDTIVINEPSALAVNVINSPISCYNLLDGALEANVTGGNNPYSYNWTGPNLYSSNLYSIYDLEQGVYILTVVDSLGCTLSDTSIIVEPLPLTQAVTILNPSCYGELDGELSIVISGGSIPYNAVYNSISYSTNDTAVISNLPAGSDSIYIYDVNGCESTSYVSLIFPAILSIDSLIVEGITCYAYSDGELSVIPSGGTSPYTYELTDNLNTVISTYSSTSGLGMGSYQYQIIDANNCITDTIINIDEPNEIEINQSVSCYGSIFVEVLNASENYQIFWDGDFADSVFIENLSVGQYNVTVIDDLGCVKSDSFNVNTLLDYEIFNSSCQLINDGVIDIYSINSNLSPYSLYLNGELIADDIVSSYTIENLLSSNYHLTLIDNNGCEFSDSLFIDYIGGYNCIEVPVIVSPNRDGTHDNWHPIYDIDTDVEVIILNRWGVEELYYKGNSLVFEWDGLNSNGNQLPSSDYYYIIKFNNQSFSDKTGVITLIR